MLRKKQHLTFRKKQLLYNLPKQIQVTQEELEQAAALLILAAAMSETDQAAETDNSSSEDSYTEDERKSALIHDVVETNLADNIVYE